MILFRRTVRTEISQDPASPRSIDFEGHIVFGVRARLGQLQTAAKEQFVPLVTQEISVRGRISRKLPSKWVILWGGRYQ